MAETTVIATDAQPPRHLRRVNTAGIFTIELALERVLQMPGLDMVTLDLSAADGPAECRA